MFYVGKHGTAKVKKIRTDLKPLKPVNHHKQSVVAPVKIQVTSNKPSIQPLKDNAFPLACTNMSMF